MTFHLTWPVHLVFLHHSPLPLHLRNLKASWPVIQTSDMHPQSSHALFFYLMINQNFTTDSASHNSCHQSLGPLFTTIIRWLFSGTVLLTEERWAQRASVYTFFREAVPCSGDSQTVRTRSLSPPSSFVTWTMSLSFLNNEMETMISTS